MVLERPAVANQPADRRAAGEQRRPPADAADDTPAGPNRLPRIDIGHGPAKLIVVAGTVAMRFLMGEGRAAEETDQGSVVGFLHDRRRGPRPTRYLDRDERRAQNLSLGKADDELAGEREAADQLGKPDARPPPFGS